MGIGELGSLFDVLDQIGPGSRKALVRLRLGTAFNQSFHHSSGADLLTATIKDLLLKLCDQSIGFNAELDGELRHLGKDNYLICSIPLKCRTIVEVNMCLSRSSNKAAMHGQVLLAELSLAP